MAAAKTLEDIIAEQAPIVCEQIEAAVSFADSEEDLRIECEKAIEVFRKEADLPELKGHHEVTIGKGRADSVYDYVFIEYKKPGRLKESNDAPGNREVIKQLQERAKAFKSELKRDPKELFGVGTDGNYFITARYRSGRWEISPARERSVHVVEDFLRKLSSLGVAGKPFLADYLAGDFGAESERKLAREGIEKLYWRIREVEKKPEDYPKAKVLFDQWRILFGEVCGYDIKSPSSKIKQLGEFYGVKKEPNAAALLFAVHSYYALFMKFLAAEIATMFNPLSASFLARLHQTGSTERLREELRELEDGGIYRHLGIKNFLEGDLFSWYLDAWDDNVEKIIRQMVAVLDEYDPKTLSIDPIESRDLLKKLYQQLFPKTVRHDLGEYYTPDWLAEHVLNEVGYEGDPDKRLIDPACGSGTFLVMAINKVREYADKHMIPKHELLPKILNNIVGFDLNPLAVMAARTNYLLALRELLKLGGEIEIPVYLCDSIMTPAEYGELITKEGTATGGIGKVQELKTSAARFMIPTEIAQSRQTVAGYTDELEHCVRNDYTEDEFISRLKGERIPVNSEDLHRTLYQQVLKLKKQNQNDIWARIIKNSFAPLFIERCDFVVGNPPWINWNTLPPEYRDHTSHLWQYYGLFTLKGFRAKMTAGKVDLSSLFFYVAHDKYLKNHGSLGFVIALSVFKTTGGGEGFRRLQLPDGTKLRIVQVHDMTDIQPFEMASNWTSVVITKKDRPTEYPVPFWTWNFAKGKSIKPEMTLQEVLKAVTIEEGRAQPSIQDDPLSIWFVNKSTETSALNTIVGKSYYKAREGTNSEGANGVYWVRVLQDAHNDCLLVENMPEAGKKEVVKLSHAIEADLLFPLLRWRNCGRWVARCSQYIIVPHDLQDPKNAIALDRMKRICPNAYSYFNKFKELLLNRSCFRSFFNPEKVPFYSLHKIGPYSFAPYKVVWRRMDTVLRAAVVSQERGDLPSNRSVMMQETITMVPFQTSAEAHYLCAILNSSAACALARAISKPGTKSFGSAHVLNYIPVPRYDPGNKIHQSLSSLSEHCHSAALKEEMKTISRLESEIDTLVAQLWGISSTELARIQNSLPDK